MMNDTQYTFDNIEEFYDKLGSKHQKMVVYGGYVRDKLARQREKEIEDMFNTRKNPIERYVANIIGLDNETGEEIAVVEYWRKGKLYGFHPYVTGKVENTYCFITYDEAIIAALALKYIGNTHGVQMIFRALNMLENK